VPPASRNGSGRDVMATRYNGALPSVPPPAGSASSRTVYSMSKPCLLVQQQHPVMPRSRSFVPLRVHCHAAMRALAQALVQSFRYLKSSY
jgi:hypothetical protein